MFPKSGTFYEAMYVVGFAIMMVYDIGNYKRYNLKKSEAVIYTLYTYVCGIVGAILMGLIYNKVHSIIGVETYSNVAIFGAVIFTPVLFFLFPVPKKNRKNALDMLAPGVLEILTCAKFGCLINGCCRGIISDFGFSYYNETVKHFPVQAFEVATMLIILFLTQMYFKRSKHYIKGSAYPITFAAYSVSRFFFEFFRYYENSRQRYFFMNLTFWQWTCVFVLIVSVATIIILKVSAKQESER